MTIPNSVTEIGASAFAGCTSIETLTLSNSLKNIAAKTFYGCTNLKQLVIPNSVTELGEFAFNDCSSLETLTLSKSLKTIGASAFSGCAALKDLTLPNSVTEIGNSAYSNCKCLISVIIPDSVRTIGSNVFRGCPLDCLVIGKSVEHIGSWLVAPVKMVEKIYVLAEEPPVLDGLICRTTKVVYIPKGTLQAYKEAEYWSRYAKYFQEMGALELDIDLTDITLSVGKSERLDVTVDKDDEVSIESETWTSSDPDVAMVDNGVVTAVSEGVATITYTVTDGYGLAHSVSCEVTVSPSSGVEPIITDAENDAPYEYYTLDGTPVSASRLTPGLYIRRRGCKAEKILVR